MIVTLFKHRKPFINVVGPSLRVYAFTNHRFYTQIKEEQDELEKLAKTNNGGVYIDENEPTIDTEAADPISKMQKDMREKILNELRGQGRLLEDSDSKQNGMGAGLVHTASSTITSNSAAERAELERQTREAEQKAAAATGNPALAALERLKQGNKPVEAPLADPAKPEGGSNETV